MAPTSERVTFNTEDGVTIVGDFRAVTEQPSTKQWVILFLHMMPATRSSWSALAAACAEDGFSSLAIDLRGHGESVQKGSELLDYASFSDADHQASLWDIKAAIAWLHASRNVPQRRVILTRASIGANLALWYAAENPSIPGVALLSPGLNYRGIETLPTIQRLQERQQVLLLASRDDKESNEAVEALLNACQTPCKSGIVERGGHGTMMLTTVPSLTTDIRLWANGCREAAQSGGQT